jgi:hypothetical protein
MAYSLELPVFIVKSLYSVGNVVQIQLDFHRKFICIECPSRSAINRLVQGYEKMASFSVNNIARVNKTVIRSSSRSIKRLHSWRTPASSILSRDLEIFPYKPQRTCRNDFCCPFLQFLQENHAVLWNVWFTAEAHFHHLGYVNKQNIWMWVAENPSK